MSLLLLLLLLLCKGGIVSANACARCNFVLPDIDFVFAGAVANNAGATPATTVGPAVCPVPAAGSFICT